MRALLYHHESGNGVPRLQTGGGRQEGRMEKSMSDEPLIAVFIDFENLALGVRAMQWGEFKVALVLKRLLEKGRLVYKRAYCDWSHYREAVREFHSQGIALIDIPQSKVSGKNSADIHMVVDAIDRSGSRVRLRVPGRHGRGQEP